MTPVSPGGLLFSIVESPDHPDFSRLYDALGYEQVRPASQRKAMAAMKARPPDVLVADFIYGYGNNYAGANISNLDVMLRSLLRYNPGARVIVLATRDEAMYAEQLAALFNVHRILLKPVTAEAMRETLSSPN